MSETRVDIVLPSGEQATVPEADLEQALAAGAQRAPTAAAEDDGGALGAGAAAVLGAGSTATLGLSDRFLSQGAYVAGGREFQKDVTGNLAAVRERNKLATMAGEGAGLFLNPAGISGVGEAAEGAVAARLGEGLLGSAGAMAARGAAEGAILGAQHQVTEDALGDHELTGQKIFASAAKDALLGGAIGGTLGAGGYYLGQVGSALRKSPGRVSDAVLDEVAGAPGAGRTLREQAKATEGLIEDLRKTGLTSDQATGVADDIGVLAKERVSAGPASGLVDNVADAYAARVGGSTERLRLVQRQYADSIGSASKYEEALDRGAQKMAHSGTSAMRNAEEIANEVHFKSKPEQMAKLVDTTRFDKQRDAVASLLQDADETLKFWESTAAKGGAEGALKSIRKTWTDALYKLAAVEESGAQTASRDLFVGADKLKQELDSFARWGQGGGGQGYGLPEAVMHDTQGLRTLADKFRSTLEDESVWGRAGAVQREWNESFSSFKARRDHFGQELGVSIDQQRGMAIPEVDFKKVRRMLSELRGNDIDADLQAVKSTEAFIDGLRTRVAKIQEYGDLSEAQRGKLEAGLKAIDEFQSAFTEARQEAATVNRLRAARLDEQGSSVGGLVGLVTDAFNKPLTTIERLAAVKQTTQRLEKTIAAGMERFFGQKGAAVAEKLAPRPKAEVAAEISQIRDLAGNPAAAHERVSQMVGDLEKHAPKVASEVRNTATRAIYYLAKEAPKPAVPITLLGLHGTKPRYSDQQIADWEAKRRAVLGMGDKSPPELLLTDMRRGKLNREAIKAIEFVSPKLFAELQDTARAELERMAARGQLQKMPYQQQAALASLLKVPAGATWTPDFMAMMQAAKATPAPSPAPEPGPMSGPSKRAIKMNTDIFATEAGAIEGRSAA